MLLLVAYDVRCDAERERIARLLEGWGERLQLSVFLLDDPTVRPADVLACIEPLLGSPGDRLGLFSLCRSCARRSVMQGPGPAIT